ncbi:MAG: response regulator [Gammaproteobacteria bacterium]|nr:response regulator [Gammaproteobacteria bacterium]
MKAPHLPYACRSPALKVSNDMSAAPAPAKSEKPADSGTVLFVDDERHILSSLRRLFRPAGYKTLVANGGKEGLEVLDQEDVDVIVSDMRMPEMDGAAFLKEAAARRPDTVRMLLTGYSDIESAVSAINDGHIYRYINKPWDENDLKLNVQQAVDQRRLVKEKKRLEALTKKQNDELKELNANLEQKVKERTEKIQKAAGLLQKAHDQLKQSYVSAVQVFANLIQARSGDSPQDGRWVVDTARHIAVKLKLSEEEQEHVRMAAMLCDIGKLTLPDELVKTPFNTLLSQDRKQFEQHPKEAEAMLLALEPLAPVAALIRSHCERYDGNGYPDGLAGDKIPRGARILKIIKDYDALLKGRLLKEKLTEEASKEYILGSHSKLYDPEVAKIFGVYLEQQEKLDHRAGEIKLGINDIRAGMTLARDLITHKGILVLAEGQVLNERVINKLQEYIGGPDEATAVYVFEDEEE